MNTIRKQGFNVFTAMSGELAAVAVAMMLGSSAVHANDHVYNFVAGSACEAIDGNYGSQVVKGVGSVSNKSATGTLKVSCPMVTGYWNYGSLDVTVSVRKNTDESMTCSMVGRNWDSTVGAVTTMAKSGTGHQDFEFYDVPQWYFNTVRCDIPKATTTSSATRNWVNGYRFYQY